MINPEREKTLWLIFYWLITCAVFFLFLIEMNTLKTVKRLETELNQLKEFTTFSLRNENSSIQHLDENVQSLFILNSGKKSPKRKNSYTN